jgi:hypothetical protein
MNAASGLVSDAHYRETIHCCMVFEEKDESIGRCYQKLDQCSADVERIEYICLQTANEMKSN